MTTMQQMDIKSKQIAFYILEGHSTLEASVEFRMHQNSIENYLHRFATSAFYNYHYNKTDENAKLLKKAYLIQKKLNIKFFV